MAVISQVPIKMAVPTKHSVLWLQALPIAEKIIKSFEGFRSETYDDADGKPLSQKGGKSVGKPTIGYGFTEAMRKGITARRTMTEAEASMILREELLGKYGAPIEKALTNRSISPSQFAALLSMAWSAGAGAVVNSDVLKLLNAGKAAAAATKLKSWYVSSRGKKLSGLVRRRAAEAALLSQNDDTTGVASVFPVRMFQNLPPPAKVVSVGVVAALMGVVVLVAWKSQQNNQRARSFA